MSEYEVLSTEIPFCLCRRLMSPRYPWAGKWRHLAACLLKFAERDLRIVLGFQRLPEKKAEH